MLALLTAVAVIGGTYHAAAPMQVKQCALRILSRDTLLVNTSSKTESFNVQSTILLRVHVQSTLSFRITLHHSTTCARTQAQADTWSAKYRNWSYYPDWAVRRK